MIRWTWALSALLPLLLGCPGPVNPEPDDDDDATADDDDDATGDDDDDDASSDDDDTSASPSVLLDAIHVGDYTVADLEPWVDPAVVLDNGYSVWTVTFATGEREARATVTIPYEADVPEGGWHVVANQPGTTGSADACAVSGTTWGAGLSGLYGARGFVGVALDYPGVGTDGSQAYLVAEVEGHAALNAVRAARELAADTGVPTSGRFALVGLSQGGHATLSAAARHASYAPELDLAAVSISGPATAWEEHWSPSIGIAGTHQAYHALVAWTWAQHHDLEPDPFLLDVSDAMDTGCITTPDTTAPALSTLLGTNPYTLFDPGYLAALGTLDWGGGWEAWGEAWDANRIRPWDDAPPLKVWQGAADATVPEAYTAELVAALEAGGMDVDYEVVPGVGHGQVAHGFLAVPQARTEESLAWLRDRF